MMDFFFFVKTMILTVIVVLLLQIEIGKKTVETHLHDLVEGSIAAGFLGHAAHGGAHFIHDATRKVTDKMKENIGLKHKHESSDTKASRFKWGWDKGDEKSNDESSASPNEDVD